MTTKKYFYPALALIAGVLIGGVTLGTVRAAQEDSFQVPPFLEPYLDEAEQTQLQEDFQTFHETMNERHDLMQRAVRESVKTDNGIQTNITWSDPDDVQRAHELFDEQGGEWGSHMEGAGMHHGRGFFGPGFAHLDDSAESSS